MLYEKWIKEWKSALAENFFLRVLCMILAAGIVFNTVALRKKDRVIVVPPKIEKEVWLESNKVSDSYLEQMGIFFTTFAANMSPINAEYNSKVLAEYTDPSALAELKNEIASQGAYFKKNNITQAFFPESVKVNAEDRFVSVEGTAVRYVGSVKISQEKMVVNVRFKVRDYNVKIDELYSEFPERKKKKEEEAEKAQEKKRMKPQEKEAKEVR